MSLCMSLSFTWYYNVFLLLSLSIVNECSPHSSFLLIGLSVWICSKRVCAASNTVLAVLFHTSHTLSSAIPRCSRWVVCFCKFVCAGPNTALAVLFHTSHTLSSAIPRCSRWVVCFCKFVYVASNSSLAVLFHTSHNLSSTCHRSRRALLGGKHYVSRVHLDYIVV